MKRYLLFIYFMIFGLSLGFAQSGRIVDDIYVTPNDAQMVNEVRAAKKAKEKAQQQAAIYRNGAREIVFIDQHGNRTTAVSDTVYVVDNEVYADSLETEEGYYLNGFSGSKSDFEYAERIRRFHNPRYTITIADPGYNDIYFLDSNYWNVYVDGMYATITPTWTNPYWYNYQWAPYSYSSWAWRHNWGYPSWGSYYGWGGGWYNSWYSPWYSGYYGWGGGWYDPWYSGYYGGWGGYYGYGYGYGYPYYGGGYGWGGYPYYGNYYSTTNQRGRANAGLTSRSVNDSRSAAGVRSRSSILNETGSTRGAYTTVSRQRVGTSTDSRISTRSGSTEVTRGPRASGEVDTRMRTGAVRSSNDWNNVRSRNDYSSSDRSSSVINRTNPTTRSSSSRDGYNSGRTYESSRSSGASRSTYDSGASRSAGTSRSDSYSSGSSSTRSSSSGSYSGGGGSSRSSSGGSYGGGGGGSSRSSGGGGRR